MLDFTTGLNPLGMPVQVARAIKVEVPQYSSYPDPLARDLMAAISKAEDVDEDLIAVCSGASDALARIVETINPHRALLCTPGYPGIEGAFRRSSARVVHHSLVAREDFDVTERIVDYIEPDIDAVFLCTPNNPTGRVISRELLCKVLRTADRWGTFVVVDESLIGFTEEHSALSLLDRYRQLIVVRSFTKFYSMAGVRLGWCACGRADMAQAVREAGLPWGVTAPAQVAGLAALDVAGYADLTREYVAEERVRLQDGLREAGMMVIESASNYILFQSPIDLSEKLLERGFAIARYEGYRGLDRTWFGVSIRTREDNIALLRAINELAGR